MSAFAFGLQFVAGGIVGLILYVVSHDATIALKLWLTRKERAESAERARQMFGRSFDAALEVAKANSIILAKMPSVS